MTRRNVQVQGMSLPLTLTVRESQELTGLGRDATYAAVHRGELPSIRVGRRIVIPTMTLLRMLGLDPDTNETAAVGAATVSILPNPAATKTGVAGDSTPPSAA